MVRRSELFQRAANDANTCRDDSMITRQFNLSRRRYFPFIFSLLIALAIFGYFQITDETKFPLIETKDFSTLGTLVGGIFAFMYFFYKQHDQDTDVFLSLFWQLNLRYDKLNENLNEIASENDQTTLTKKEQEKLCDYFNLCAEQYMYFTAGYIDVRVWESWTSGMFYFYKNPRIKRFWDNEILQNSYYDFDPKIIFKNKLKQSSDLQ